ncbi:transporter substrate-binding domain-containing protein [Bosea sp. 117]|uniref:substrate-binding periplasmic protein n=1 Tax=Bosea sp. 117 TaxID=1125973 RepID=UPI0009DF4F47|nr:transporter substrate-binding domain-containing protein [Bosea sp. 117]
MAMSRRALLAAGGLFLAAPRLWAQEAVGDVRQIVDSGALRIATPGFSARPFFRAVGEPEQGLDFDLGRGIAAALGVKPAVDRSGTTFDSTVQQITEGRADLAIGKLSRTLKRARVIRYSAPYARLHHGLLANRLRFAQMVGGRTAEDVIRDYKGDLGVIAGSSFAEYAPTSFPNARVREFGSWREIVEAIRAEQLDMAYRDDFEIKKLLVDDPSLTVVARSITLTDKTDTLAIGIRPDAPHLKDFVNLFLELDRNGKVMTTDELIARYRAEAGV